MYSHLTTYTTTGNIVAGLTYIDRSSMTSGESINGDVANVTSSQIYSTNIGNNGLLVIIDSYLSSYIWNGLPPDFDDFFTGGEFSCDIEVLNLTQTSSAAPFSIYTMSFSFSYFRSGMANDTDDYPSYTKLIPVYKGTTSSGSCKVLHYGSTSTYTESAGGSSEITGDDGYSPYYTNSANVAIVVVPCKLISGEYYDFTTNYTVPVTSLETANIPITITTIGTGNFEFLGTQYPYTFTTSSEGSTVIEYTTTTIGNYANATGVLGTSVAQNNNLFTLITEGNISPIAGIVNRPDNSTFHASDLSVSYTGLVSRHNNTFRRKPISSRSYSFNTGTVNRYDSVPSTTSTIYNVFTYTEYETSSSRRIVSYDYDGSTAGWETATTLYTTMRTSTNEYYLSTLIGLTNLSGYFPTISSTVGTYLSYTSLQSTGSLLNENGVYQKTGSISFTETDTLALVTFSISESLPVAISNVYTETDSNATISGAVTYITSGSTIVNTYSNDDTIIYPLTAKNFFSKWLAKHSIWSKI